MVFSMPKYYLFCLLYLLICGKSFCQENTQSLLNKLNKEIGRSSVYDAAKNDSITAAKYSLDHGSLVGLFNGYRKLYEEYKEYNYDSAYAYTQKLFDIALQANNDSLFNYAKINQSFILLSAGMFKEAFDSLNTIRYEKLDTTRKAEYFTLLARCYYDLADYDNDRFHTPDYNAEGYRYLDSAIRFFPAGSFDILYYNGLKDIRSSHLSEAMHYLKTLMNNPKLTLHETALTASTLSDLYIRNGETDTAVQLLVQAAIADIKSSTKETTAAFNLSSLLFKNGDLKDASFYIKKAMNDAVFYGARQRKVQLSDILSLIESERIARVESERKKALIYAGIVTLFVLILVALIVTILRQFRKLKAAEQIILQTNLQLQETNGKLSEANKIKEEYIGYFFNGNSEIYAKIERFKRNVEKKVMDRKLDEILFLINHFNLKQDKEELLKNFDSIFLKLFPNFIVTYNHLFNQGDQTALKDENLLNTDLRIFALIRLGIHENEKIAEILGYSVHTINSYKTKIKNKSIVPNEEFEQKIMEIKSV